MERQLLIRLLDPSPAFEVGEGKAIRAVRVVVTPATLRAFLAANEGWSTEAARIALGVGAIMDRPEPPRELRTFYPRSLPTLEQVMALAVGDTLALPWTVTPS